MPIHWESSTRPLFVKTVLVNGNRHAILTQEDPLGHNNNSKPSRPSSPDSGNSDQSCQRDGHNQNCRKKASLRRDNNAPKDLQSCLVRLRVVLATQDTRTMKSGVRPATGPVYKKRKHHTNGKKLCNFPNREIDIEESLNHCKGITITSPILDINQNVTVAAFFTEPTFCSHHSASEDVGGNERISGYLPVAPAAATIKPGSQDVCSTAPTLGMSADYDVPWNNVSPDSYFTRPFYNRLSERVLQWLDLSSRRNPKHSDFHSTSTNEGNASGSEAINRVYRNKKPMHRASSEDNSDEVRTDEDVETALSSEFPKFSQDLNRQHYLRRSIPVKAEQYPTKLQESIAESFTSIVSIRSGKYAEFSKADHPVKRTKRKGHLSRQVRIDESSDDDLKCSDKTYSVWDNMMHPKQRFTLEGSQRRNFADIFKKDGHWSNQLEGRQQLHIFIPDLSNEQAISDSESVRSES